MRKFILCVAALLGLSSASMADIVIKGTHIGNTVLFGTLTVNCQNSTNECARIRTNSIRGYDVEVPGMEPSTFHCEAWDTSENADGETVNFYNCTF